MRAQMNAVFEHEVRKWVDAWIRRNGSAYPDVPADAEALLRQISQKFPAHVPLRIGFALHTGALVTDTRDGRGYFLGRPGDQRSHTMLGHTERTRLWAASEMFVHMSEFAALAIMARRHPELEVMIEDDDMDLTVRLRGKLIAYVEVKYEKRSAQRLVDALKAMQGVHVPPIEGPRKGIADEVKKANYMLGQDLADDVSFAVRAGGDADDPIYEACFVARLDRSSRTFTFEELCDPVPLHVELAMTTEPRLRAQACLAWHLERGAGVLLGRGRHGDYVAYRDHAGATLVVVGAERRGSVYTYLPSLAPDELARFEECLRNHDLTLGDIGSGKGHRIWKHVDGKAFILTDENLARRLGKALGKLIGRTGQER